MQAPIILLHSPVAEDLPKARHIIGSRVLEGPNLGGVPILEATERLPTEAGRTLEPVTVSWYVPSSPPASTAVHLSPRQGESRMKVTELYDMGADTKTCEIDQAKGHKQRLNQPRLPSPLSTQ